ncbi:GTP pyrophosphokinase [Lachnobacterium bovis]|uniref:Putative GTP pyrophosphokinase n=1 Tax=Lachnobacterium bovis TaxID=140626 RepID=A0A1H9TIG0_9FIRM|nr:hypothetical protein [Lachnobacterium bovis]SER96764.1 putative GTP pyrophosphokinase [Lachnobacterium bovis]
MEHTLKNTPVVFRTRIEFSDDEIRRQEIIRRWKDETFQHEHSVARNKVIDYIEFLNKLYIKKTGEGFARHIESRMKTADSICEKLQRKGCKVNFDVALTRLNDISGVRVICFCLKDIYWIVNKIKSDGKYQVIKEKDYIKHPKSNGYQSYHLILGVPIETPKGQKMMRVEIQLRTIIMDAWASVDQRVIYKKKKRISSKLKERVKQYGKMGNMLDDLIQVTLDENYKKV